MHPLVRDLYKRVVHVGRDYPLPMDKVREIWKKAIRNPQNCPSCYNDERFSEARVSNAADNPTFTTTATTPTTGSRTQMSPQCEQEIRRAVGKGRHMVREMIGIIQLKKYRTMKRRYGDSSTTMAEIGRQIPSSALREEIERLDSHKET